MPRTTQTSPPSIYSDISEIADPYKGILLDAYGVFWGGNKTGPLPGSENAMKRLVTEGKTVIILSNSTQLADKETEKLRAHGIVKDTHFHFLITSGEIAKQVFSKEKLSFKTPNKKFSLFSKDHPKYSSSLTLFEGSPYKLTDNINEADFIYLSIPHINGEDSIDPNDFLEELKRIKASGLPLVCANPDRFAHEGSPAKSVVRQGSIALLYQELGGTVHYIGKPYLIAYDYAMESFKSKGLLETKELLMVGDTPETDIRGANKYGIDAALTLETGNMADRIKLDREAWQKLPTDDRPRYLIKRLGGQ